MKKLLCVLCALCLIMCTLPVMAVAEGNEDLYLTFNSTDWSGNTELINEEGKFYAHTGVGANKKWSLTYNTPLELGD